MTVTGKLVTHERLTDFELDLRQRLGRREFDRGASGLLALRHLHGAISTIRAANQDSLRPDVSLHGLEVEYLTGWSVQVSPGEMIATVPSPTTLARPVSWSGRIETDDAATGVYALPIATATAPISPPSGALAAFEKWIVYVSPTDVTVESDSAPRTFNQTTGTFDATQPAKVVQHQAVPKVARGASGGSFPTLPLTTDVPIAYLYIPSGATDLSGATILDVRRSPAELDLPNEVGGAWDCPLAPLTSLPDSSTAPIWRGTVWARLAGERLTAMSSSGLSVPQLAEPGATWDSGASVGTPKFAWLYLCKVNGRVPRPRRFGAAVIGSVGNRYDPILDGALVLSPKPPRISAPIATGSEGGGRWDLRASASIALPNLLIALGATGYPYGGINALADDCICVGCYRYVGVDSSSRPTLYGLTQMDADGWLTGDAMGNSGGMATIVATGAGAKTFYLDITMGSITVASVNQQLPFDGVRAQALINTSAYVSTVILLGELSGVYPSPVSNGTTWDLNLRSQRVFGAPGISAVRMLYGVYSSGPNIGSIVGTTIGVRWPTGVPLVT